jgi:ketosteroid isomerase-like protein
MGELQAALEAMFEAFERGDTEALLASVANQAQGVDEISRKWMRGPDEVQNYLRGLVSMVTGLKTVVTDGNETIEGDTGLLTCWIEQDYTVEGTAQHVSAPTTVIFKREAGAWRFSLFHSIPLPPEEA